MHPRRAAFSLIELLVVIAIIAVLIALLLPAVQKVREAAARTTCLNNCKQMGLAMHSYLDAHRRFPPAGEYLGSTGATAHTTHSFFTHIAPFLEQGNAVAKVNLTQPYNATANQGLFIQCVVPGFLCPTNPARDSALDSQGYGCTDYAPLPYVKMAGASNTTGTETALGSKLGRTPGAIIDGLSNSIGGYEDVGRSEKMSASRYTDPVDGQPRRFWRWTEPDSAAGMSNKVNNCVPDFGNPTAPACPWVNHDTGHNNEPFSFHGAGCHMWLMDGSARWVSDAVSLDALRALATHNGREVIPAGVLE